VTPLFILFLYLWLAIELLYQTDRYITFDSTCHITYDAFNLAFFTALIVWARLRKNKALFIAMSIIGLNGILFYLTYFNFESVSIRNHMLNGYGPGPFIFHYIEIAFILAILALILLEIIRSPKGLRSVIGSLFLWLATFVIVYIASFELIHISVLANYQSGFEVSIFEGQAQKIGLPILWGICSFSLLFIGLRRFRMLRIISLVLFFITLLKLFIFDLRGISEAGRIAAFIILGILLLVMSFMYQKVKKLIFDEDGAEIKAGEEEGSKE
jgi:hypothetical protein